MRLLKHKNCKDVVFRIIARGFKGKVSEHWAGVWMTVGTTKIWPTIHDDFFVRADQLSDWEEYVPKLPVEYG